MLIKSVCKSREGKKKVHWWEDKQEMWKNNGWKEEVKEYKGKLTKTKESYSNFFFLGLEAKVGKEKKFLLLSATTGIRSGRIRGGRDAHATTISTRNWRATNKAREAE